MLSNNSEYLDKKAGQVINVTLISTGSKQQQKQTNKQTTTTVEDITWPRGDTKFLFE